ncbi:MAG TPA: PEGA domain-containing protein [Polyangia bacterium]|jgi:hypothetical protein
MTTARECERVWELLDDPGPGALTAEQARLVAEHRAGCPGCALEVRLTALGALDAEGPAGPLDDLAARRFVEAVLAAAAAPGGQVAVPAGPRRRSRATQVAAMVIGLAAAVAAAVIPAWRHFSAGPRSGGPAVVLLASGAVAGRVGSARAGDALAAGETITVGEGRAALEICGGTVAYLAPHTRARLLRLDRQVCTIGLESGRVALNVAPRAPGTRVAITTVAGEVEAVGTLFSVEVRGAAVTARVLRGVVMTRAPGQAARRLLAMEAAPLGGDPRPLAPAEAEADRQLVAWPEAGPGPRASLELTSTPPGAAALVDGHLLGPTPVSAVVAPGDRAIEVVAPGHAAVREYVRFEAGSRVARTYALVVAAAPPSSGPAMPPIPDAASGPAAPAVAPPALERPAPTPRRASPLAPLRGGQDAGVAAAPPDAAALLATARRRRTAGDWAAAASVYHELAARFPRSAEARAAQVPHAQLLLDRLGDPAGALALFDRYLAASAAPPLAEEAAWGRIRALRQLGRAGAERAALARFLGAHPMTPNATAARRRLAELGGAP